MGGPGRLAQLVERRPYKAVVGGSSPSAPTRDETLRRYSNSVSHRLPTVRTLKPRALLTRLLAGTVTNVAFSDARKLLVALGFDELRVRGGHHVYGRPGLPEQLNLQDRRGQAKPYQLRQLVALVRRYDLRIEEDE
jgi:hypothetical protein